MPTEASITEYSYLQNVFDDETVLLYVPFDINADGNFTSGIFAISKTRIAVFENEYLKEIIKINELERVCCGECIGNGVIEAFYPDCSRIIARFSMQYINHFGSAAEMINEIISGDKISPADKIYNDSKVCPKCKRPYIRDTHICRHCTDKFSVIKRIWRLSAPCRPLYALLLVYFWINSAITVFSPVLRKHLVNDVLTAANKSKKTLILIVLAMLLCSLITAVIEALRNIASSKASNLLVRNLRNDVYEKLQKMPISYVEEKKTGDLMQRINNDTQRIQSFIQDIGIMAINEICMFIAIAVVTFSIDPVMSILIFVPMPFSMYLICKIRYVIQRCYRKQWRKMDVLTNRLTDVLNGIKVVKVFGREDDEVRLFQKNAGIVRDLTCKNEKYVYTIFPIIKFIMSFGGYFVLLYGGSKVIGGKMSVGELVQFSSYGSYLYSKLEWFSMLPRHFTMAVASSQRVFEVLDENAGSDESASYRPDNINGDFRFDDLNFGYKSYRKVLRGINFEIKSGEMIGLVGHSGAGKSTLINLVMRLYNPDRGKILLDGVNLSEFDGEYYKGYLGIVLQESYLFSGNILDNIRYAAPDATIDDCVIAAKRANAHDFIMKLPDGYNTYVGEKGYKLSGGERQRIAIARAIAANPDIVILDEATSSVDTETEEKIQQALANVTNGKTVIAIAHRLSTLKNADRLIVLEEGKIAETGTHEELIRKNGIYASLLKAQRQMAEASFTVDGSDTVKKKRHPDIIVKEKDDNEHEENQDYNGQRQ